MASEDAEARRKHRRSPDGGGGGGAEAVEGSKRRKHSHSHSHSHRHHHHHHRHHRGSKKHENDIEEELEDLVVPDADVVVPRGNSRPIDDDMEEGEILEEEEQEERIGVAEKKIVESDVESGEIKPDEAAEKAENRNLELHSNEFSSFDKGPDGALLNLNYSPDDNSQSDTRDEPGQAFPECSDGKNTYEALDQVDTPKYLRSKHLASSGKDYRRERREKSAVIGSDKSGDSKRGMQNGDLSPRDGTSDLGTDSPLKREKKKLNKDGEVASERNGRSRTLSAKEDVDSRDRRKIDDQGVKMDHPSDAEGLNSVKDFSCRPSESLGIERSNLENWDKSTSPNRKEKYEFVSGSPSHDKYHGRSRSRSRDHAVQSRSHTRSHFPDREASYDKLDFKSYSDGNDRSKFTSREITRCELDREGVVGHDRKERGGSRERVRERERERERERSSSYSRYGAQDDRIDNHGEERGRERKRERSSSHSRYDSYEKERGRERKREHSSSHSRHSVQRDRYDSRENEEGRERKRERSSSYSRYGMQENRNSSRDRDRERGRGRGREREKEREKERKRESDRERDREKERRFEGADRDKDRGAVRDGDRDRGRDRNLERVVVKERSRDVHIDSRRAKQSEYYRDRTSSKEQRSKGQGGISNSVNDSIEVAQNKLERDEVDIEGYEERVALKLAEQEEEDVDRIKEESRKRRQAILEKYKQNQSQKQAQPHTEGPKEGEGSVAVVKQMGQSSPKTVVSAAPEGLPTRGGSFDVSIADPSFSVGKPPLTNGNSAFERTHTAGGLGDGSPKSERAADMFSDDIFGESPAGVFKMGKGEGVQVERSGLNDNWDDAEGYYSYRFGELLDGRYEVLAAHGRGVFSTVVRAKDLKAGKGDPEEVAIKIIRNNETMYKAGLDELVILKKLAAADPEDRRHCVRFLSSFKYRNHLCLVFESLHMNLREVLKKFGRNIGLKLTAVRAYGKQLFIALKHLRNCGVLHCDIKPDNMLVNEAKNVLKLCDFGNAMFAGKNEITPYLVSRFYRAPEIILGLAYDHPMDMWSVGCCLYELYSGKVLFPGPSNNDMLRLHMELKGPIPKKMLRKGAFTDQHFDQDLNFHATEEDPVTKKAMKRLLINIKPKDIGNLITGSTGEDPKMLANFKDLLEKIFVLDPEKRMTVSQALSHPFITEHLTAARMKCEKVDVWVKTYPLGVSFSGMCSVSIGFFQCYVAINSML